MNDGEGPLRAENKEIAQETSTHMLSRLRGGGKPKDPDVSIQHVVVKGREGENPKTPEKWTREREGDNPKTPIIG